MVEGEEVVAPAELLTMQIIIGALTMGIVSFLAVALVVGQPQPAPPQVFLSYVALAFAVTLLPASVLVPRTIAAAARKQLAEKATVLDPRLLVPVYQTQMIVGAALNEGVALLAVMAYFLEKAPLALGLAVVLLLGLVARFPTRSRVEQWIDAQTEKMDQDRQFAG